MSSSINLSDLLNQTYLGDQGLQGVTGTQGTQGIQGVIGAQGTTGAAGIGFFNVKDYGAVGDGTANDTTAIQSAINAAVAVGVNRRGCVWLPPGLYRITAVLTLPANPQCDVVIRGAGMHISIIRQDTAGAGGFAFNLDDSTTGDQLYTADFEDFGLRAGAVCGDAITVTYGSSPAPSYHKTAGCGFVRFAVKSPSGSEYWANGITLENGWNPRFLDCWLAGKDSFDTGTAIRLQGMCVNTRISRCDLNFWDVGFSYIRGGTGDSYQNTEGITMEGCTMVPVRRGVYILANPTYDGLALGLDWDGRYITGRVAWFSFANGHIDSRGENQASIWLEYVESWFITHSLLIASNASSPPLYGNEIKEGNLKGCTLFGPTDDGVELVGKSTANVISGNVFRGQTTQVRLEADTKNNKVFGNTNSTSATVTVVNAGTSNLVGSTGN